MVITTKPINIALVGNPNVGKSVIFNYLTGLYVDVSNYPGTTIEISKAMLALPDTEQQTLVDPNLRFEIVDTPGVYGVSSFNDEEKATRDYVLDADIVVNVVSTLSLGRDLFLTKQLIDMGKPMIILFNLSDEAKIRKLAIDTKALSKELGVEILETVATKNIGLAELKHALLASFIPGHIEHIKVGHSSKAIDKELAPYLEKILARAEALMILEGDEVIAKRNQVELASNALEQREKIYQQRRVEVNKLIDKHLTRTAFSKRDWFGRMLLNPIVGSVVAIATLYVFLYQFLGVFVAGDIVNYIEQGVFQAYYEPWVRSMVTSFAPIVRGDLTGVLLFEQPLAALGTFLAGDYGVLTLTVTYLFGLLFPLVFGFYLGLSILEDSGYLPRLAVLVDGVLSKLGMNGRAIVPLILGGGCVTMAVVTTRLLKSDKEKIITMALLGLTIPCSAQLGVIQGLLSNLGGVKPWLIWGGTLMVIFALTGTVLNRLLPGESGHFISDLPTLRFPSLKNIWKKTYARTKIFLEEAAGAFFVAAALVAGLQVTGLLNHVIAFTEPLVANLLLLPKEVALSFILGMVRRDFGAFGLLNIEMSAAQLVTACIVLTLFVPCIATVAVTVKEKDFKTALAIWLSSWLLAFGLGAILARLLLFVL